MSTPKTLHEMFDDCQEDFQKEFKHTIQNSLLAMMNGASTLVRLVHFFSHSDVHLRDSFDKMNKRGKIHMWISNFTNLAAKVKNHFDMLQSLLIDLLTYNDLFSEDSDSYRDYKECQERTISNFYKLYPNPSDSENKSFFIQEICEDTPSYYFDEEYLKGKGLVKYSQREDGRGMSIVSQSIASKKDIRFSITNFEISINGS